MELICPKEVQKRLKSKDDLVILDIREGYELDICGIDAIHIPMEEVQSRLDELPSEKNLIIMCQEFVSFDDYNKATLLYPQIQKIYKNISRENQMIVYRECLDLQRSITEGNADFYKSIL